MVVGGGEGVRVVVVDRWAWSQGGGGGGDEHMASGFYLILKVLLAA